MKNERNLVLSWLKENRFIFMLLGEKLGMEFDVVALLNSNTLEVCRVILLGQKSHV